MDFLSAALIKLVLMALGCTNFTAKSSNTNITFISQALGNFGPLLDNVQVFEISNEDTIMDESSGVPLRQIYTFMPLVIIVQICFMNIQL